METKSRPKKQIYDYLMQNVAEGMLVLDAEGIITSVNHNAASLLGYETAALLGQNCHDLLPEASSLLNDSDNNEVRSHHITLHHQDGRSLPVNMTVTPISTKTTSSKLISITNLADVDQLNEALTHTQRLAGVGLLTASMAHELNNPISIITATCGNLLLEMEDQNLSPEQLHHYVQMIEQNAWRCARIVEVLRNYTFEDEPHVAVTDLNMIVEDGLTLVQQQFQGEFNVSIETDLAPDLKSIVCDHNRITQVLINLLTNARDAMQPDGGTIHIKTWATLPETTASSNSAATTDGEQLAFSVRDSGHGIAPEIKDKIFDPFFTTKPNGTGTGLGLFIARRIVKQHNGRIWNENNPDGGTTFTVVLPPRQ